MPDVFESTVEELKGYSRQGRQYSMFQLIFIPYVFEPSELRSLLYKLATVMFKNFIAVILYGINLD